MAYPPADNGLFGIIDPIATRCAKEIRHMETIDHDPEGLRIKALIVDSCYRLIETILPPDDGTTVHITRQNPQMEKVITPVEHIQNSRIVGEPATLLWTGICSVCNRIHDPRKEYGHAAAMATP